MEKCKNCALKEAKPCYECNCCAGGDNHFRPIPQQKEPPADAAQLSGWIMDRFTQVL